MTQGGHVVVGVTGGIAAYKTADLVSRLVKASYEVSVVMTPCAGQFVGEATFASLSGRAVLVDPWATDHDHASPHVMTAGRADLMIIAPCTMNTAARLAGGFADDAVTLTAAALDRQRTPLLIAPSMNAAMLEHPATRRNLAVLEEDGCTVLEPDEGWQACRTTGVGRMPEPESLMRSIESALSRLKLA